MRPSLFLLYVFLLFCSMFSSSLSEKCNPYDKKALLQIKKDFRNPYTLASWDPKTDCCEWYVVKCDLKSHRVVELSAFSGGLSGQIPASIGNLPFLETLTFKKQPYMTGPIQPAIANLKNLKYLDISWTNISGPVPEFLTQLTKLNDLVLSFNRLSGSIPSSLSKLPNLRFMDLSRNKFTGSIPGTFGQFRTKDFSLYLSHNQLSGKIPTSLGKSNFGTIDVSWNKLQGDASFLFRGTNLWKLDASRNQLAFSLSSVKTLPKSLRYLDLSHNKISGGIPQSWRSATLEGLDVSYNNLCGQIPVGGKLQRFDHSSYSNNKCLCGSPLPNCK
ncbi:hypothetical protein ACFE04_003469 [Oxalis oulophora]